MSEKYDGAEAPGGLGPQALDECAPACAEARREELASAVGDSLYGLALAEVHRTLGCSYPQERITEESHLAPEQPLLGAMMLASNLIEIAGTYSLGSVGRADSRDAFELFVNDYLGTVDSRYNARNLWEILRSGLFHKHAIKHHQGTNPMRFVLVINRKDLHLSPVPGAPNHIFFNVQSFIDHLDQAVHRLLDRLERANSLESTRAIEWFCGNGVMTAFSVSLPAEQAAGRVVILGSQSASRTVAESKQEIGSTIANSGLLEAGNLIHRSVPAWRERDRSRNGRPRFIG